MNDSENLLGKVRNLPPAERKTYVDMLRVKYPRWNQIYGKIRERHVASLTASEPQCLLIIGGTGVGKTILLESYRDDHPSIVTDTTIITPVVLTTLFAPPTPKNALTAILMGFNDPRADKGTQGNMTKRVVDLYEDCKSEVMLFDELQDAYDKDKKKVVQNITNLLKYIIKQNNCAAIFAGLKGEAEQVINSNEQLARLFGDPVELAPFQWDVNDRENTVREFTMLLETIEDLLPLNEKSNLIEEDLAYRLFVACAGKMGYLMALIGKATKLALDDGKEKLDSVYFELAFDERLAGDRREILNPFADGYSPNYSHD